MGEKAVRIESKIYVAFTEDELKALALVTENIGIWNVPADRSIDYPPLESAKSKIREASEGAVQ